MPATFSNEAAGLIAALLQVDPTRRLGAMARGIRDIQEHPLFAGVVWDDVLTCKRPGPLQALSFLPAPRVAPKPEGNVEPNAFSEFDTRPA